MRHESIKEKEREKRKRRKKKREKVVLNIHLVKNSLLGRTFKIKN